MSFPFALLSVLCLFALRCQSQQACAVAVLSVVPGGNAGTITGTVKITQRNPGDAFKVDVNIQGLTLPGNGLQGLHIHQFGDLRGFLANAPAALAGGLAAGPHYDPANTQNHGCADTTDPFTAVHMGDLGNWNRTGGAIVQSKLFKTTQLSLRGSDSILGRMIILHSAQDDCISQPAGNSGSRIAAGVLGACNVAGNTAVAPTDATFGVCVLQGTTAKSGSATGSAGFVSLTEVVGPLIQAQARVVPGDSIEHGFHVHQFGDITDASGASVGGHLNLDSQVHGLPGVNSARHLGDFGSIKSYDAAGNGYYDFTPTDYTPASSLRLTNFIGRSVIIHETLDHGNEPTCPGSDANGAAGARWFQCVIGVANPDPTLEVVTVPGNVRLDNTWVNVPCVVPTEAPTAGPPGGNPSGNNGGNNNQPYGLSGGAVVGILIAIFFVMILLTICITCIVLKVCCKR